jgi:hypothetical protein
MNNSKDNSKDKLKSLIKYLAMSGGREKVPHSLFSFAVLCNIFVDSW